MEAFSRQNTRTKLFTKTLDSNVIVLDSLPYSMVYGEQDNLYLLSAIF